MLYENEEPGLTQLVSEQYEDNSKKAYDLKVLNRLKEGKASAKDIFYIAREDEEAIGEIENIEEAEDFLKDVLNTPEKQLKLANRLAKSWYGMTI